MQLIRTININVSADHVWGIVGTNFNDIGKLTSQVISSMPNPDLPEGAGRVCTLTGGQITETFTDFSDAKREFTYAATTNIFPFFVRALSNSWSVKADGPDKSTLHMHMRGSLIPGFAQIMGPLMKKQTAKSLDIMLDELKYYAETDQVHPSKQKMTQLAMA